MNPIVRDHRQKYAAWALKEAIPKDSAKDVADVFKFSRRHERGQRSGERPSWVTETVENMEKLHEAVGSSAVFRVGSHLKSAEKWIVFRGKTSRELVERYHDLVEAEHGYEARQNRARNQREAHEEILADECHAAILTEIAAVRKELEVRGVCPHDFQPSTNGRNR